MISKTAFVAFLCAVLALSATAVAKPTCAVVLCKVGTKCIDLPTGPKCVPISKPCLCPKIYKPVCCKTSTGLKTVSNSCVCKCNLRHTIVYHKPCITCRNVLCRKGYRCIETSSGPRCVPIKPVCICTKQFAPVCCKLISGQIVTKGNPCLCTKCNLGARILHKGACVPRPPPCICGAIFKPVCCKVTGRPVFTTNNACLCGCRKGKVIAGGQCK